MRTILVISALALTVGCSGPQRSSSSVTADDSDGDGIDDLHDKCPHEPEDFDGHLDGDGCPDPDVSDHAVMLDVADVCSLVPGCENGMLDDDGCPDAGFSFETHSKELSAEALAALEGIATELKQAGRISELQLVGSAERAEAAGLADARAAVVREALLARGVPASMLSIASSGTGSAGGAAAVWLVAVKCA